MVCTRETMDDGRKRQASRRASHSSMSFSFVLTISFPHACVCLVSVYFADLAVRGTLHSVDQYLNIKLLNITVEDKEAFPHMQSVKNCFIRGSVIKYVQLPASEVDTELLQDATRRESNQLKSGGK